MYNDLLYGSSANYSGQLGFTASALCFLAYYNQLREVERLRRGLQANEISFYPLENAYVSRALMVRSSYGYTVAVEGTTTGTQWAGYLLNSGVATVDNVPGQVFTPFRDIGLAIALRVQAVVNRQYPVFLSGHSLGGAAAAVAARILAARGYNVSGVVTIGSPRFCDQTFADGYHVPTYRLFHRDDPVPGLPPDWSLRLAAIIPGVPVIPPLRHVGWPVAVYDPNQRAESFDSLGWFSRFGIIEAIPAISKHLIGSYCRLIWNELPRPVKRTFFTLYAAMFRQGFRLP